MPEAYRPKGLSSAVCFKMPGPHFGGSKRLSVSNRYSSYWAGLRSQVNACNVRASAGR
jgi:hypothetical protein